MSIAMTEPVPPTQPLLRVVDPVPAEPAAAGERRLLQGLRLSNLLHSSLDLNEVLRLFVAAVDRELGVQHMVYRHESLGLSVEFATAGLHSCSYRLENEDTQLGELRFSRAKRFGNRELERLETLISSLVPALRNALQYLGALRSASRDALTGVGNRIALEVAADREIALARRSGQPVSILVIDIDHFKHINDKYGHTAGDSVLIDVARKLRGGCREGDSVFRFGGEEFVVLLSQTEVHGAATIAERIRSDLATLTSSYQQQPIRITASIGVASLERGESLHTWFDRADRALYLAKRSGRNLVMLAAQRSIA